ncbi:MAG TPA: biotin-dependent carboxyltransferase family protein [Gemmatimonadaceae bacterium]
MSFRIEQPGLFTTVQDLGRVGHQREGVPVSGAMDPLALRVANLLVGNDEGDAALEITLRGPTMVFERDALIALTGADLNASIDGERVPAWRAMRVSAGATLAFGAPRVGCRAYLAVAGGIAVPPVLGSRSTYTRAKLGGLDGRALRRGDILQVGSPSVLAACLSASLVRGAGRVNGARWGVGSTIRPVYSDAPAVRLIPGAHEHALTPVAREQLYRGEFRISSQSDRMGYRLEGPALELALPLELLSEPVAFGTVQLPPSGSPIVLMADRQTTGGYPRIGEVATVDLPLLAQLKPGDRVRFTAISLEEAQAPYVERERELARVRQSIALEYRGINGVRFD